MLNKAPSGPGMNWGEFLGGAYIYITKANPWIYAMPGHGIEIMLLTLAVQDPEIPLSHAAAKPLP